MQIRSAKVENYKSYLSTETLTLEPGLNVIVGENNAGKTALLEAISLRFGDNLHRSLKTAPAPTTPPSGHSVVEVQFDVTRQELLEVMRDSRQTIHVPKYEKPVNNSFPVFVECIGQHNVFFATFENGTPTRGYLEAYGEVRTHNCRSFTVDHDLGFVEAGESGIDTKSQYGPILANQLKERIYFFLAERLTLSRHQMGANKVLAPNASNLPEVLLALQFNRARFDRLVELVRTILPVVKGIAVKPINNQEAEVMVWTVDPQTQREDLAVPLAKSGTGIGQVLAMLYVVLTSEYPRVIVIDEPQSFLHPGAIRKLVEIFREYPQHQYIFTTHSPTALTSSSPDALFLVQIQDGESQVRRLDVKQTDEMKLLLAEVGARLSDVFGADSVLWVEGRTEELCFPIILEKVMHKPLRGTTIVGVLQVGDIEGKRSKTVIEIYERLSQAGGLVPPAVGFIFDRENRSEKERDDLIRQSKGKVTLTGRRMFENYLLNADAIAATMNEITGFSGEPVKKETIEQWMEANRWNKKYLDAIPAEKSLESWEMEVHAGRFLEEMFWHFSNQTTSYSKTTHGLALTSWITEHAPKDLEEIGNLILSKLAVEGWKEHSV